MLTSHNFIYFNTIFGSKEKISFHSKKRKNR